MAKEKDHCRFCGDLRQLNKLENFFVGQTQKQLGGRGNIETVRRIVKERLWAKAFALQEPAPLSFVNESGPWQNNS